MNKWNSGKSGKLTGFKSSKDLHHRSIPSKELSLNTSVAEGLGPISSSQDALTDGLNTVEESSFDGYKAFPIKERISKMKRFSLNRLVPFNLIFLIQSLFKLTGPTITAYVSNSIRL